MCEIDLKGFISSKVKFFRSATVTSGSDQISFCLLLEATLSARNVSDMEILDFLFRKGADVNTTDFIGLRTPLHIAAMTGNSKLIV